MSLQDLEIKQYLDPVVRELNHQKEKNGRLKNQLRDANRALAAAQKELELLRASKGAGPKPVAPDNIYEPAKTSEPTMASGTRIEHLIVQRLSSQADLKGDVQVLGVGLTPNHTQQDEDRAFEHIRDTIRKAGLQHVAIVVG